ncbi:beta-1,3-galactosyltransferase 5 [Orussus abietinus]|uniref:beta-1,3-galactosyltransferase 5 n=1 Tax=Orussus abietinus TaxID=222816 RepID=UPI000625EA54|nr:beta-1,3-galactosyltransferase 5 [Orussus abietinus]
MGFRKRHEYLQKCQNIANMMEKRRVCIPRLPSCVPFVIVAITIIGCLSFWLCTVHSEMFLWPTSNPAYLLVLPENISMVPQPYSMSELDHNDKTTLVDIKNFKFTINHDPCNNTQPLLLMMIHSAPANFPKRLVVRETWGHRTNSVVVLFLVGYSNDYQLRLEEENKIYGDLIQGNFLDAYRNMTYKHVMALKWAAYHCPSAKYVLKLDDDVFVHVPAMLEFLTHSLSPLGARRLILCDRFPTAAVKRSWRSKWRVSPQEYPGRSYPSYCSGYAILYSPDSVFLLYREAQRQPYFWIDDVHVTGILARRVNLTKTSACPLVLTAKAMKNFLQNPKSHREFIFGPPDLTENTMRILHNVVSSNLT